MTFRPGQAKGPNLSSGGAAPGSFAPVDAQYVTLALNGTLTQERVLTAGSAMTLLDTGANGAVLVNSRIPVFYDDFNTQKDFWGPTQALRSGDFQWNAGTFKLDGIANNNTWDWIRRSVEGRFDYQVKVERGTATDIGIRVDDGMGGAPYAQITRQAGQIAYATNVSGAATAAVGADTMWLRIIGEAYGPCSIYYKVNDGDAWTLVLTEANMAFGGNTRLYLHSANNGFIRAVYLYDNMFTHMIRSVAPKYHVLFGANPIAVDARIANFYSVTMGGNWQLGNPTNPAGTGQKIIFRVKQAAAGGPYALTFDTKYRFSTSLPSPSISTTANYFDYLGFMYHETDDKWDFIAFVKGFV